jgi:hypothetical protein
VIVGSVPWWYANAHTGFVSLQRSALPANGGITYGTKLSVFFHDMLPLQLGLRTVVGGNWVGGTSLGVTLYVAALAIIAAAVVRSILLFVRDSSERVSLALAVAVVCFPFLYAAAGIGMTGAMASISRRSLSRCSSRRRYDHSGRSTAVCERPRVVRLNESCSDGATSSPRPDSHAPSA